MGPVSNEVAAAIDALYAKLMDARESGLQRREVRMDVGDDRHVAVHAWKHIH